MTELLPLPTRWIASRGVCGTRSRRPGRTVGYVPVGLGTRLACAVLVVLISRLASGPIMDPRHRRVAARYYGAPLAFRGRLRLRFPSFARRLPGRTAGLSAPPYDSSADN